jgi:predicted dehydrogenase
MQPIKLGIVGAGLAAKELHWPALKQLNDLFEITMVCSRSEAMYKITKHCLPKPILKLSMSSCPYTFTIRWLKTR